MSDGNATPAMERCDDECRASAVLSGVCRGYLAYVSKSVLGGGSLT